jgi:peptide subunit release factor 1 (eRF1)
MKKARLVEKKRERVFGASITPNQCRTLACRGRNVKNKKKAGGQREARVKKSETSTMFAW